MNDKKDAEGRLLPDSQRLTSFGRFLRSVSLIKLHDSKKLQSMKSASLRASKDFGLENAMKFVAEFQSV